MNKEDLLELQQRYGLSEEEYQRYYQAVNLYFTTGKKRGDKPRLIFVAGQAGAGKSKLIPVVNRQLRYNGVILDSDTIRAMHPRFEMANSENPENVHLALLPDVIRADADVRQYCKENGISLIYEGTMRGTDGYIKMAEEFKDAGYDIGLALMAVPRLESYGSTLVRYATALLNNNSPRWVPKSVHDESYDKFIVTLEEFSKRGLFNRAEVYRRGTNKRGAPIRIYSTEEGQFRTPIEAIEYGREHYRRDAIKDYSLKHALVYDIFSKYSPNLLGSLGDWEELYESEKRIIEEKNDKQESR